jgi:hypothetical protein
MPATDIANIRLISQQIVSTNFKSPKDIVKWMGAMQAQDYGMVKWAIGLRFPKATVKMIEAAIDSGEIIRTHLLRPTWHFVPADDIYWMLSLTAPRIKASMKSRNQQLELTEKNFSESNNIIEKALSSRGHLTRKELVSELNRSKIATDDNRASHILLNAELDRIICSGRMMGKQTTYALLSERVTEPKLFNKEEALHKLAKKYFDSHCPATLPDFVWWSGLSVSDAKHALEMIKDHFISEKINLQEYWFPRSFSFPKNYKQSLFLLPAFDEFLISYKDRSAAIMLKHQAKAFSKNGIFWPTIVINGQVRGIWKREIKKDKMIVEANFFESPDEITKALSEKAAKELGHFLNHEIQMVYR